MIFDLEGDQAVWFELEGGGRVQLRTVTEEDWKAIRKETVKKKVDFRKVDGTPQRFEYQEVDSDLQNELFMDRSIVAWENLFDKNGKEIPCTRENKILLINRSRKFERFVTESLKTLMDSDALKQAQIEKN